MQQPPHRQQQHYSTSPSLSSVPTGPGSEPGSPTRVLNAGRANIEMDEIIVDPSSVARFSIMQQQQPAEPPKDVPLTAAGLPRKKPGRKPGSTVKPKVPADVNPANPDQPKQRRPRKPKDPNAPPVQRKRKAAATEASDAASEMDARSASGPPRQTKITELTPMRMALDTRSTPTDVGFAPPAPKRESGSGSMNMQNLLNEEPQPKPQPARQMFDPIRGNYDPIRESMVTRDPYGTGPLGSPRPPTQAINRASASPSIASLVDPHPAPNVISPRPSYAANPTSQPRFPDSTSVPPSPSNAVRSTPQWMPKPTLTEARRGPPPTTAPAPTNKPESKTISFTSMTSIPSAMSSGASTTPAAPPPLSNSNKKIAAVVQQERDSHTNKKARSSAASSSSAAPRVGGLKEALPALPSGGGGGGHERSILDFGKARPGEELEAPSITLRIPLQPGESNKYVNFMRMAEERYGWDALHPRLAASRERKARIAAATAALERTGAGSGRDGEGEGEGEEMEEDIGEQGSDVEGSNVEMGGVANNNGHANTGNGNGPEEPAKPARKKRNFKEDEYDKDDDFVDDSEMLWEEQAAASRDGFFVYSGPLIPEVEKPTAITKLEKEARDREKAEREKLVQMASAKTGAEAGAAVSSGLLSSLGAGMAQSGVAT
ncbi:HPC2-domain-containing protein [Parathielavia hyrcaniae]|uniref:HPC2-domain-containing protein n=1 Tax=Parathielavia hyrcaniae TaxID=113614 RepID=A0AAN6Q255_9PEZI|nr:HPC2-domain-containing protein [Parathielavia hyrcaniae]